MREILFRGKRIDSGEWVNGSFCMDATEQLYGCSGADGFIRRYITEKREMNMFEVERETVGQFTGLTDCNGVKIFEGDVVEYSHPYAGKSIHAVVQDGCRWNLSNFYASYFDCPGCAFSEGTEYMTVIGNIHDNPELLEVSGNV